MQTISNYFIIQGLVGHLSIKPTRPVKIFPDSLLYCEVHTFY